MTVLKDRRSGKDLRDNPVVTRHLGHRQVPHKNSKEYKRTEAFRRELEELINKHSMEGSSNTPDFILASYLLNCLRTFDEAVTHRAKWWGHES